MLIENPRAFENAIRSGLAEEIALICTFGFGLAYLGQEWLHRSETPEQDRPIMLVRHGDPPSLTRLLGSQALYLWADLDLAAIGIYRALKSGLPQLRWSGIYAAMLPMLEDPMSSHPYARIFEKAGQLPSPMDATEGPGPDAETAWLWSACKLRAVDQEAVADAIIRRLGGAAYELRGPLDGPAARQG